LSGSTHNGQLIGDALYFSRFLLLLLSPSGKGDRDAVQIFLLSDSFPAASGAGGTDLIEGHLVLISSHLPATETRSSAAVYLVLLFSACASSGLPVVLSRRILDDRLSPSLRGLGKNITRAWLFAGSKILALLKRQPHDQANLGRGATRMGKRKTQAPSSKHEHGQSPPSVSASFSRQIRPEIKTRQPRKLYTTRPLPGNRFNRSNHPPTRPGTRSNVGTTVRVSQ